MIPALANLLGPIIQRNWQVLLADNLSETQTMSLILLNLVKFTGQLEKAKG